MSELLEQIWVDRNFRAAYARKRQAEVAAVRRLILILTVGGAVFQTWSPYVSEHAALNLVLFGSSYNIIALSGAVMLLFAALLGKQLIGGETRAQWVDSRAVVESLKSLSFRYVAGVKPFNDDAKNEELLSAYSRIVRGNEDFGLMSSIGLDEVKLDKLEASRQINLLLRPVSEVFSTEQASRIERELPDYFQVLPVSRDVYLERRVKDQKKYYLDATLEHRKKAHFWQLVSLALAWSAAVLGLFVSNQGSSAGVWVAVITTIIGAVSAHYQSQRFEDQISGYVAAANQLDSLIQAPPLSMTELVERCENVLNNENRAWTAGWQEAIDKENALYPEQNRDTADADPDHDAAPKSPGQG